MKYTEIKAEQPVMKNCFFAFSKAQFAEGLEKFNLKKEDILSGGAGLYGTRDGIKEFLGFYDKQNERIADECDPQEVYQYEFDNHECEYTHDDTEAIKLIAAIFGDEKAKLIKRHNGYVCCSTEGKSINEIIKENTPYIIERLPEIYYPEDFKTKRKGYEPPYKYHK